MKEQQRLMLGDKDVADLDAHSILIAEAEQEYNANPDDVSRAMKLVDALLKTEHQAFENRAIEILQIWYERTKQFRFRLRTGEITMKQLSRQERAQRQALAQNPTDETERANYAAFVREKTEFELKEFMLAADAYPTDMRFRFEIGKRLHTLGRYQDAIPIFQQARSDPKYKFAGGVLLGQAFLEAGFVDEAVETLAVLINDYQVRGDETSKQLFYWRARALEQSGKNAEALKHYSQVAQWDFNYRDVQGRIKKLRTGGGASA
jgi:tetratricopeptide (TPR) repeat protein